MSDQTFKEAWAHDFAPPIHSLDRHGDFAPPLLALGLAAGFFGVASIDDVDFREITSEDGSVTITGPLGPVTDLSVAMGKRLVYGSVYNDGNIRNTGSGDWGVVFDSTNNYRVFPTPAFSSIPVVVATPNNDNAAGPSNPYAYFVEQSGSPSRFSFNLVTTDIDSNPQDGGFDFLAVSEPSSGVAANVAAVDSSGGGAYLTLSGLGGQAEVWASFGCYLPAEAITTWTTGGIEFVSLFGLDVLGVTGSVATRDSLWLVNPSDFTYYWVGGSYNLSGVPPANEGGSTPPPDSDGWHLFEFHYSNSTISEFFIDGSTVWSTAPVGSGTIHDLRLGLYHQSVTDGTVYYRDFKLGTTQGGTDLFQDDFSSGDLSAWSAATTGVSVVPDPLA